MAYSPDDFGLTKSGPQFAWLETRLTLHGFPPERLTQTQRERVQRFQLKKGWRGTGADGLIGPLTLAFLSSAPPAPKPVPTGIDLTCWKVTLPTGEEEDPTEWFPIGTHEDAPWFVNHGTDGITFRAPVNGVTTKKSGYPRSELREMDPDGSLADWSNRSETRHLTGECAVTALPGLKPEVVFAQIHDDEDDVVMLLVSGDRVYASWSKGPGEGSDRVLLFSGYTRGSRLVYDIAATPEGIAVSVNGYPSSRAKLIDGAYFKAGCYTQANEDNGTGYGEVVIYKLSVTRNATR